LRYSQASRGGSIIIVRFGFLEVRPALATFFGALACAGLVHPGWPRRLRRDLAERIGGMSRILLAMLIDVAILAYPPISLCNTASCPRFTTSHRSDRPAAV